MIGKSLYTAILRLSSLNWKDSIVTFFRGKPMAKGFNIKPQVVVSQGLPSTEQNPLYCIEENVTTGWEIIETNLTKDACKSKYEHIINTTGLPLSAVRIRRIQ